MIFPILSTNSVPMSHTYSWLCGVVAKTSAWESVGCEIKYSNFWGFLEIKTSLSH